jgi:hypothetical protein
MELNLIPWDDDAYFEVRRFKDGVNAFTGIHFEPCGKEWVVRLDPEYEPAMQVLEINPSIETSPFSTFTEGLRAIESALRSYSSLSR